MPVKRLDEYRNTRGSGATLRAGSGGGTYDGMEARIARLEKDSGEIKADLKAIRSDLSYLRGKADAMPTTIQLIGFAVAVFVAAGLIRYIGG